MRRIIFIVNLIALLALGAAPAAARTVHPLAAVLEDVQAVRAKGGKPVVVFDLDDTVFRVGHRTRQILRDWAWGHGRPDLVAKLDRLDPLAMPYLVGGTLDLIGVTGERGRKSAQEAWGRGFFGSDYLLVDPALAGAQLYIWRLKHAGAHIVYLTGRDLPRMGAGTRAALRAKGFPTEGEGVTLMMKPEFKLNDLVYKTAAVEDIKKLGTVVASFDNEPKNLNMFQQVFPGAHVICLDTPHSPNAPKMNSGIPVIPDYRLGAPRHH